MPAVTCGKCGAKSRVPEERMGGDATCPECGVELFGVEKPDDPFVHGIKWFFSLILSVLLFPRYIAARTARKRTARLIEKKTLPAQPIAPPPRPRAATLDDLLTEAQSGNKRLASIEKMVSLFYYLVVIPLFVSAAIGVLIAAVAILQGRR